ncbi:unnamed protein product [Trifolium pratense]|uniref:Uncharacterized protein n=1 Tax=Trifolium pratense TaxID=57577 RepID=A0ACB0KPJ5_TRIPR|nr:unnamed protein product [Trifolium pratense]
MEKSVTLTIMGKVSKHIPDDILFSILSKLSLKSLNRFKCVSKSWSMLFKNPCFMRIYRDHIIHRNHSDHDDNDDASLILRHIVQAPRELQISLYLVSGDNFENKVKLDTPLPSQELGQKIIIVGIVSINGILCLTSMVVADRKVVLWNPATDELKVIPPSPVEYITSFRIFFLPQIHGFGYDGVKDDYKVLRYVQYNQFGISYEHVRWNKRSYEPSWEIYREVTRGGNLILKCLC